MPRISSISNLEPPDYIPAPKNQLLSSGNEKSSGESEIEASSSVAVVDDEKLSLLCEKAPRFESMIEALDSKNAGLEEIAHTVGYVMRYGESDTAKLAAARLASELRGIAKGKDSTTITFILSSNESTNLLGIFNPQR